MSPDEIATLLESIADRIELAVFDPSTHVPVSGEKIAFTTAAVLREVAGEVAA
jgi:hypothetical protein